MLIEPLQALLYTSNAKCGTKASGTWAAWLGNPVEIPQNSVIIPIPDVATPEFSSEFHSSDHKICSRRFGTRSGQLESSPAINSSNFMHRKTFPPFLACQNYIYLF
jgi:hypothetical protein